MVREAFTSPHLALRLRPILIGDSVVLFPPGATHDLAGFDRRLARRDVTVLPTTIAIVDPATAELVLPGQALESAVPAGRLPLTRIHLYHSHAADPLPAAAAFLELVRSAVWHSGSDRGRLLAEIARLLDSHSDLIALGGHAELAQRAHDLPASTP